MKKLIAGMIAGVSLVCTIFFWPVSSSSASGDPEATTVNDVDDINISSLVAALNRVESEIEDEDLQQYYRLLIDTYDLESTASSDEEDNSFIDVLPDVDHIVRAAAQLPLREAGKNIRDPEIAEFYHKFLEDVGWEID